MSRTGNIHQLDDYRPANPAERPRIDPLTVAVWVVPATISLATLAGLGWAAWRLLG